MPRLFSLWHIMHFFFKIWLISRSYVTVVVTSSWEKSRYGQNINTIVSVPRNTKAFLIKFSQGEKARLRGSMLRCCQGTRPITLDCIATAREMQEGNGNPLDIENLFAHPTYLNFDANHGHAMTSRFGFGYACCILLYPSRPAPLCSKGSEEGS